MVVDSNNKWSELEKKLTEKRLERAADKEAKQRAKDEDEKLPEEDYNMIDEHFTTEYSSLDQRASDWKQKLTESPSAEIANKYFDELHSDFVSLRDHISNYQYAIPSGNFSRYQIKLEEL